MALEKIKYGYENLSKAFIMAQQGASEVICLDDNPFNILTKLNAQIELFKNFPSEQKPKVMVVNLLNVSKNPGSGFHPIGLGYLISAIKSLDPEGVYKDGVDCHLKYYNEYQLPQEKRTDKNFLDQVKKFSPDMVLFTATTSQTKRIGGAIKYLKSEGVKPLTVVGGADVIIQPEVSLERTGADIAIVGEGPIPVKMLVAGYKDPSYPLSLTPGLVIPEPDGQATRYGKQVYFEDLDKYDEPRIILSDEEKKNGWEMTVTRSVGCPYNCPFCGSKAINEKTTGHRAVRIKSDKAMLNEIEFGLQNNIKSIYFADDTLFMNAEKSRSFLEKLRELQEKYSKEGKMIPWVASSRISEINKHPELIKLAVDAGCIEIEVGKESGSDRMIKKIGKNGNTNKELIQLMDHIKKYPKLKLGINFIIGLPGSEFNDEIETIRLTTEILDRKQPVAFHIHRFAPLPGTDYWDNPEKHGLVFDKQAVMDHLSTYGVEDFVESKSLPHNQVELVDEILNTVLRAKGAISFRSPYLAALSTEEQRNISTFVTPGESEREVAQKSLELAKRFLEGTRADLQKSKIQGTILDTVRHLESHSRYVLRMGELLTLAYQVVGQGEKFTLPARNSFPILEQEKNINWYLEEMLEVKKFEEKLKSIFSVRQEISDAPFDEYYAKDQEKNDLVRDIKEWMIKRGQFNEELGRLSKIVSSPKISGLMADNTIITRYESAKRLYKNININIDKLLSFTRLYKWGDVNIIGQQIKTWTIFNFMNRRIVAIQEALNELDGSIATDEVLRKIAHYVWDELISLILVMRDKNRIIITVEDIDSEKERLIDLFKESLWKERKKNVVERDYKRISKYLSKHNIEVTDEFKILYDYVKGVFPAGVTVLDILEIQDKLLENFGRSTLNKFFLNTSIEI